MLSVAEARGHITAAFRSLPAEQVALPEAIGRVLAEDVRARLTQPPFAASAMDGYAVRSADVASPPVRLKIAGYAPAGGARAAALQPGEAVRIFTGAPLPEGADAVVPQEDVAADGRRVTIRGRIDPGAYVRPAGEDVRVGDVVVQPGGVIGPAEVGLLATLGYSQVQVYRRPRVAILSTGNELADLGTQPGPAQIPNTNTYSLMAQVIDAGGEPVNLGVARDQLEAINERVRWGLTTADMLVTSAGVSVGELDLVRESLQRSGAELHLWQVSMRPGKPITFGTTPSGRPVFGLPGNPVSAMVTFELFVRPALRHMAGATVIDRPRLRARALEPIANPGSRRGYLRVTLTPDAQGFGARLTGDQGSAILRSMVLADGLAVVAPDTTIAAGETVDVIVLRALEARSR
jgi:molybdopterin molybdotransferase